MIEVTSCHMTCHMTLFVDSHCDDTTLADCSFDKNLCLWTNRKSGKSGDDFDWLRNSGDTISKGTGPSYDHTLGNLKGLYSVTTAQSIFIPIDFDCVDPR